MRSFTIIIFTLNSFLLFSQKKVTAYHKEYCSEDITQKQCKQEAIIAVKEKALLNGGIGEGIKSYTSLTSISINDDFKELLNDQTILNINGFIKDVQYVQEPTLGFNKELKRNYYEVKIKATVKEYKSKADLEFDLEMDDIKSSYYSDSENLKINIKPSKDCYLKIFYSNDFETVIMYPLKVSNERKAIMLKEEPQKSKITLNRFENQKLIADEIFDKINYIRPFTEKEIEIGKLILIITKENIPFNKVSQDDEGFYTQTNIKDVLDWYLKIEPSKKNIIYKQFSIIK